MTVNAESGEVGHRYPFFLADGGHFLFEARGSSTGGPFDSAGLYVASLESKDRTRLLEDGSNAKFAQGQLIFLRDTTLMAQRFLINTSLEESTPAPITLLVNWTAGLKK